jgi:hypothetical protein
MLEFKPDAEEAMGRHEAWWHGQVIDRPPVWITAPSGADGPPYPKKTHESFRDRWFDTEYILDMVEAGLSRTAFLGDALPTWWPNLGPEVYSAFLGCPLEYTNETSWAVPILEDWSGLDDIEFDPENEYFLKIKEMTEAGLERAEGRFLVGYTDLHPGADGACAFRDPQQLCFDLVESPDMVRELLRRVQEPFEGVFDSFARRLQEAGHPVFSWLPVTGAGRVHIPSNDFSCMVSPQMMREFFIDLTIQECRMADRTVYHLDGRDAIKHLDLLLEIPELDAIQPTIGAGDVLDEAWMDVMRRTRAAGKSVHLGGTWDTISQVIREFEPEGFFFSTGAGSVEDAEAIIDRIARWEA